MRQDLAKLCDEGNTRARRAIPPFRPGAMFLNHYGTAGPKFFSSAARLPQRPSTTSSDSLHLSDGSLNVQPVDFSQWDIKPGDTLSRGARKERFGGSLQAGIAHSRRTPNIFIYTDPDAGTEHGYDDRWDSTGEIFYYTGEGQVGDQRFDKPPWGNAAVRDHQETCRALRLFEAAGTARGGGEVIQRYVGRLEIDHTEPYVIARGPDSTGVERDIIVFKLHLLAESDAEPDAGSAADAASHTYRRGGLADASALLADLCEIRVDVHEGRNVPYKYVVLLWAISQALSAGQRRFSFQDVSSELAAILKPFQVSASRPDPRNPWFALRETPLWWDLILPNTAGLTYKQTRELNLEAGLSVDAFELVVGETDFASRAVLAITRIIGDSPDLRALLRTLELDSTLTEPPDEQMPVVRSIPVENLLAEDFSAEYKALGRKDRTRKEAKLQKRYNDYLRNTLHHKTCRHEIRIDQQVLYTDLYDEAADDLIEVKSSIDRSTMRLALGQILDYAQMLRPTLCTILVPDRPAQGMIDVCHHHGVRVVWRSGDAFISSRKA